MKFFRENARMIIIGLFMTFSGITTGLGLYDSLSQGMIESSLMRMALAVGMCLFVIAGITYVWEEKILGHLETGKRIGKLYVMVLLLFLLSIFGVSTLWSAVFFAGGRCVRIELEEAHRESVNEVNSYIKPYFEDLESVRKSIKTLATSTRKRAESEAASGTITGLSGKGTFYHKMVEASDILDGVYQELGETKKELSVNQQKILEVLTSVDLGKSGATQDLLAEFKLAQQEVQTLLSQFSIGNVDVIINKSVEMMSQVNDQDLQESQKQAINELRSKMGQIKFGDQLSSLNMEAFEFEEIQPVFILIFKHWQVVSALWALCVAVDFFPLIFLPFSFYERKSLADSQGDLNRRVKEKEAAVKKSEDRLAELNRQIAEREKVPRATLQQMQNLCDERREEMRKVREENQELNQRLLALRKLQEDAEEIDRLSERMSFLSKRNADANKEVQEAEEEIQGLQLDKLAYLEEIERLKSQLETISLRERRASQEKEQLLTSARTRLEATEIALQQEEATSLSLQENLRNAELDGLNLQRILNKVLEDVNFWREQSGEKPVTLGFYMPKKNGNSK